MYIGAMDDARLGDARERLYRDEGSDTARREQELRRAKSRERIRQNLRNEVDVDEEREGQPSSARSEGSFRRGEGAAAVDALDDKQASEELRKEKTEAQDFLSMMDSFRRLLDAPLPSLTGDYSMDGDFDVPEDPAEARSNAPKVKLDGTHIFNGKLIRDGEVVATLGDDGELLGDDGLVIGMLPAGGHHGGIRTQISRVPSRSAAASRPEDEDEDEETNVREPPPCFKGVPSFSPAHT
jgi:hypothetical protein